MIDLVVTARANRDRDDILRYLAREAGPGVLGKYARRFRDAIARLREMPAYGAPRPDLGTNCRIIVVAPYLLIYDYDFGSDRVVLLRIAHGKRAFTEKLLRR